MVSPIATNTAARVSRGASLGILRRKNVYAGSIGCRNNSSYEKFVAAERRKGKLTSSYVCGSGDIPKLGLTAGQLLQRAADKWGDRTSVVFCHQNIRKTFHDFLVESDQVAAGLMALGLKRGDRVAVWGPNYYEWLLTQWGAARAGLILVNINPAYRANELGYALNHAGVKALVMAESFRTQSLPEILKELIPSTNDSTNDGRVSKPQIPTLERVIMFSEQVSTANALRWSELLSGATPALISQVHNLQSRIQMDDPLSIQLTSGTTGTPKGATISHYGLVNSGYLNAIRINSCSAGNSTADRACLPLPLFHSFASLVLIGGISFGNEVVFPSASYSGRETVKAIQQEKCQRLYGAPPMFMDIMHLPDLKDYDLSSLKTIFSGGATCPLPMAQAIVMKFKLQNFMIGYGMTETCSSSFIARESDSLETNCSTVGHIADHFEAKVVDPETREILPINTPGELWVKGYGVMLGYWNQPERTAEAITSTGWYNTGDIASLDENGYAKIVGRMKDMIIRGGENIYPREVEELLNKHPAVQEAQVIAVPDDRLGEEVCAWIRLKPKSNVTEEELIQFCKDKIAYFKVPRYWMFKEAFPMTLSGKVQKFIMREITVQELATMNKREHRRDKNVPANA